MEGVGYYSASHNIHHSADQKRYTYHVYQRNFQSTAAGFSLIPLHTRMIPNVHSVIDQLAMLLTKCCTVFMRNMLPTVLQSLKNYKKVYHQHTSTVEYKLQNIMLYCKLWFYQVCESRACEADVVSNDRNFSKV